MLHTLAATNYEKSGRAETLTNTANELPRMRKNKGIDNEPEGQALILKRDHVLTPARRDHLSTRTRESRLPTPWVNEHLPTDYPDEDSTMAVRVSLPAALSYKIVNFKKLIVNWNS
jgi:hypothetical protein